MPPENLNVEKIEQYLQGNMTPQEHSEYEVKVAEDDEFREEVEAYRAIFDGFNALQQASFHQDLQNWESEWSAISEEENDLIELYYQGQLNGPLLQQFEKRLQTDTDFAEKVTDYQQIFAGLGTLASDELTSSMQAWEKAKSAKDTPSPTPVRKTKASMDQMGSRSCSSTFFRHRSGLACQQQLLQYRITFR